ncbi:hypothetical protein AAC387_Pa02g4357 [Persea americana]
MRSNQCSYAFLVVQDHFTFSVSDLAGKISRKELGNCRRYSTVWPGGRHAMKTIRNKEDYACHSENI